MAEDQEFWQGLLTGSVSRRTVVRGGLLGGIGLATAALIGCGDDDDDDDDDSGGTATPTGTATAGGDDGGDDDSGGDDDGGGAEPDYVRLAREDGAPYPYNFEEPAGEPQAGGVWRHGIVSGHASLDTLTSGAADTESTAGFVGNFLVGYTVGPPMDKFGMVINGEDGLAKSWEVSDDGMTITFDIRNPNFHNVAPVNGRQLVAQDVALMYEKLKTGRQAGLLGTLDSVTAPDDSTVVFNMLLPDPDILIVAGNRATPIYAPEIYDAGIQDTTPIGTGPGILDRDNIIPDQVLPFVKNPDYWGGEPLLDGFEFVTLPDIESRKAAFRTGQTNSGLPTLLKEEITNLERERPGMQIEADPNLAGITVYAVNSNVEPFNDVRLRRAIKLGMDVQRYIQIVHTDFGAESYPAFGWPFLFDEKPDPSEFGPYWEFNRAEAMKLIQAGGWEGLSWEHIGPENFSGGTVSLSSLIIEDMSEIGLSMSVKNVDFAVFGAQYYGQGFSDPARRESQSIQGWSTASPTANGYFWENLHSKSSVQHFNIVDPEVDRLADAQRSETDPAARRELQRQLFDHINDQAYFMDKVPITWALTYHSPESRFYRWEPPYIGLHKFWDWGYGFHKAWLAT